MAKGCTDLDRGNCCRRCEDSGYKVIIYAAKIKAVRAFSRLVESKGEESGANADSVFRRKSLELLLSRAAPAENGVTDSSR